MKNTTDSSLTYPESRPMSPEQQMDVMLQQEMEVESKENKPSELDLEVLPTVTPTPDMINRMLASKGFLKANGRVTWGNVQRIPKSKLHHRAPNEDLDVCMFAFST